MTKPHKLPTYSHHKASGQARVWLDGKSFYLGEYGSAESRIKYAELIRQRETGTLFDPIAPTGGDDPGPSVNVVCAEYKLHAKKYYRKNGRLTAEYYCVTSAMKPLTDLYGDEPAKDFESVGLQLVRERMVSTSGWCRDYINKAVARIVRVFKHAAIAKLVPASVVTELELVEPLKRGRTDAKDYEKRSEVPQPTIEKIRGHVDSMTKDMIDLVLLTGARGGEVVRLTPAMLDQSADVWVAVLEDHKMAHEGKKRALVFGPKSIEILKRNWPPRDADRFFKVQRRTFSDRIKNACIKLKLKPITGHWFRHTSAKTIRRQHGLDCAQAMLGHSNASTTELYAEIDLTEAIAVARLSG